MDGLNMRVGLARFFTHDARMYQEEMGDDARMGLLKGCVFTIVLPLLYIFFYLNLYTECTYREKGFNRTILSTAYIKSVF